MTVWHNITVPYSERDTAAALGAKRSKSGRVWSTICTATQYKSKDFARWRDTTRQRRIAVFPDASEASRAKARSALWDPATFCWYITSTAADPTAEMDTWMRARLQPAPLVSFVVPIELKAVAKKHRLQWSPKDQRWTGRFHCGVPIELKRFVFTT